MKIPLLATYLKGSGGTAVLPTCVFFDRTGVQQDTVAGSDSINLSATTTKTNIRDLIVAASGYDGRDVDQWIIDSDICGFRSAAITGNPCDIFSGSEQTTNAIYRLAVGQRAYLGILPDEAYAQNSTGYAPPSIDSYTCASISASANTADQSVVAAPGANKQIWVYFLQGSADTADGSVSFQDEDNVAHTGVMEISRRGGFVLGSSSSDWARPIFKVATNKAFEIDTVTCGFNGSIGYAVVSVG